MPLILSNNRYQNVPSFLGFPITNLDLNSPCFARHPYGKLGLFKTESVIVFNFFARVQDPIALVNRYEL